MDSDRKSLKTAGSEGEVWSAFSPQQDAAACTNGHTTSFILTAAGC